MSEIARRPLGIHARRQQDGRWRALVFLGRDGTDPLHCNVEGFLDDLPARVLAALDVSLR